MKQMQSKRKDNPSWKPIQTLVDCQGQTMLNSVLNINITLNKGLGLSRGLLHVSPTLTSPMGPLRHAVHSSKRKSLSLKRICNLLDITNTKSFQVLVMCLIFLSYIIKLELAYS